MANGKCNEAPMCLNVNNTPFEWQFPEIKGKPPRPRYAHSMDYYARCECLIIAGGRNDNIQSGYFSDICMLDVRTLQWLEVKTYG